MNAHEISENRELTVCELEQVSGGATPIFGEEYIPLAFGLFGLALFLGTGKLNDGLHK